MTIDTRLMWFGCGIFWGAGLIGAATAPGVAGVSLLFCFTLVFLTMVVEVRNAKVGA